MAVLTEEEQEAIRTVREIVGRMERLTDRLAAMLDVLEARGGSDERADGTSGDRAGDDPPPAATG